MSRVTLTDARVKALKPRKSAYDIRDGNLRGFGVRVQTTGHKRFFVHCQHRGERVWRIVGNFGTMTVGEARDHAKATLATIRRGECVPSHGEEGAWQRYGKRKRTGTRPARSRRASSKGRTQGIEQGLADGEQRALCRVGARRSGTTTPSGSARCCAGARGRAPPSGRPAGRLRDGR